MVKDQVAEALLIPMWYLCADEVEKIVAEKPGSQKAIDRIIADADDMLNWPTVSVLDKKHLPPSGDKRDYMSLAVYLWPNPDTPDGMPYITRDGLVNPEVLEYDSRRARTMIKAAITLALAALHTSNHAYAKRSAEFLHAWFVDDTSGMRPHLEYGQFIPGVCNGRCYGIIETTRIITVLNAVQILEALPGFDYKDSRPMRQWFSDYADWLQESEIGIEEGQTTNNHRAWYVAQLVSFLQFSGRKADVEKVLREQFVDILQTQMAADGSFPRELARTRSSHYSSFILVAMALCANVAAENGMDLLNAESENGSSLSKGINWLLPYLTGKEKWQWQQIVQESPYEDVYPLMRIAANLFADNEIENTLRQRAGSEYEDLLMNLILPAKNG